MILCTERNFIYTKYRLFQGLSRVVTTASTAGQSHRIGVNSSWVLVTSGNVFSIEDLDPYQPQQESLQDGLEFTKDCLKCVFF